MQSLKAFDHTHYIPILKGKQGEYDAVQTLFLPDRAALTPLFEVPAVDFDYKTQQPKKSEAAHLTASRDKMLASWGTARHFYVDMGDARLSNPVLGDPNGQHPYTFMFDLARAVGLLPVPVIPLAPDPALIAAVRAIHAKDGRGVMVRVARQHLSSPIFVQLVHQLLGQLALPPGQVDMLLDLDQVESANVQLYLNWLVQWLPHLPYSTAWRTLTLAGCAFPKTLSAFKVGTVGLVPRAEWAVWSSLLSHLPNGGRMPTFSDYGVSFTDVAEVDPRIMQNVHNIRYTAANEWFIFRGKNLKTGKGPSNHQVCQQVVAHSSYCGPTFSTGDAEIYACAGRTTHPRNPTQWRETGTNHHLTFVVRQLASQLASSVPAGPLPVAGPAAGTP
jgi:hypothetical protein